jgi:hypothetical protein
VSYRQPYFSVNTASESYENYIDTNQLMDYVSSGTSMCHSKHSVFQLSDVERIKLHSEEK